MEKLAKVVLCFCLALAGLVFTFVALVPDPDPDDQEGAHIQCGENAKAVRLALSRYVAAHRSAYPKTLQELVPDQLSALPECRMAQSGFHYEVVAGKVELTCSRHGLR